MEGTLVVPSLKSAISYAPIPVRYGMTIGELALYFNKNILKKPAMLHVVPMKNYNRHHYSAGGLLAHLSPNIRSMNSCYGYSFLGLLGEVRPFDIGIGTDKAFQCILLPETIKFSKKKWHELHLELKKLGVENSFYRYYSARKKQYCSGLRFHIANINAFSSFSTLLTILDFFKRSGLALTFSDHFDKAMGSEKVRQFLEGKLSKTALTQYIHNDLHSFFNSAYQTSCFLYEPLPKIVNLS
ncbi:exo-beta-N-acetylmuramidase NamZ domain-containing protein [Candidatus Dependentiae bacterium]